MNNYKVLFSLRVLKSIIDTFIDTFFVLYFLDVSSDNIVPLGVYYIIMVSVVYLTIYACRNFARTKHRVRLLRIAMVLDLVYFFLIITLQAQVVQYMYLLGLLRGLEEGFYYAVYNIMESDGIQNKERAKYIGSYKAAKAACSMIFPVVLGGLMYATGFIESSVVVIIIVAVRMLFSFAYKDKNIPRTKKTNLKKFRELTRRDQRFRWLNIMHFFDGLTCSSSAFSQIITLYVVTVFSDGFSLGIFTAIFAAVSGVIGIVFAKFMKQKQYSGAIGLPAIAMIASFLAMVFECNVVTIVIFKFCRVIFLDFTHSITETGGANLSNDVKIRREYKSEFWVTNEQYLVAGRVISNLLFISMAFMESWTPIMIVFAVLLGIFALTAIKFQSTVFRSQKRLSKMRRLAPAFRFAEKDKAD